MQVKKFEAATMKEALEMVKHQLGPDAIILNAKDNSRGFGLLGQRSIEITAAISEMQLQKKQYAESRLKTDDLMRYKQVPAKIQKEFIEKSVRKYVESQEQPKEKIYKRPTSRQYIDIEGDAENVQGQDSANNYRSQGRTVEEVLKEIGQKQAIPQTFTETHSARVKAAAKSALDAFQGVSTTQTNAKAAVSNSAGLNEVQTLKNEIMSLRNVITSLQRPSVTLHPGAERGVGYEESGVYQKLSASGVSESNVLRLIEQAKKDLKNTVNRDHMVEGWIAKQMLGEIKIKDPSHQSKVQIFLGPTGAGKSASLVKLASYYVVHLNKKVGILTADTEKVGAVEQLRIYSQILNIPFGILSKSEDWASVKDSLNSLDHVLIDFPGSSLKEMSHIESIRRLLPTDFMNCDRHLVIPATFKDYDAFEMTERYKIARPTDIIFTKLDEAVAHGMIYNHQKRYDLPLFSFGIGPQLPEDFEFATKERVIDLIFKITKIKNDEER